MANIIYDQFGGIAPRLDPKKLPPGGAQIAHNCDLTEGGVSPIATVNDFEALHDSSGEMKAGFPSSDINIITKATAPTATASNIKMCRPMQSLVGGTTWLFVIARIWATYTDPVTNAFNVNLVGSETLTPVSLDYTDGGFMANFYNLSSFSDTFQPNIRYQLYGPLFQFRFEADTNYNGGPEATVYYPLAVYGTFGDPRAPSFSVPLTYPEDMSGYDANVGTGITRFQYGTLTLTDISAPDVSGPFGLPVEVTGASVKSLLPVGTGFSFTFNSNYVVNTRRKYFYIQQMVDSSDRDGPQSEASNAVVVQPGDIVRVSTPFSVGYTKNRLFRSSTSAESGYLKLADVDDTEYFDNFRVATTGALPPNGNVPHATTVDAVKGALAHPAGFYTYFYGNELRPSSQWIDEGRPWAVPEEYAVAFDTEILCQALSGGSILVFTRDAATVVTDGTLTNAESGLTTSIEVTFLADPGELTYTGYITFTDTDERVVYNAISGTGTSRTFAVNVTLTGTYSATDPVEIYSAPVGAVYRISGQHPSRLSRYELANVSTILNRRSLWRIDQMVGWVTQDGLAIFDGNSPTIVTQPHFTANQWADLLPEYMSGYANDRSIFLILPDSANTKSNIRYDMRVEMPAAMSTFDSFNAIEAQWRGRIEDLPDYKDWRWVKIEADEYPVRLVLYGDSQQECDIHVLNSNPQLLPRVNKCKEWEIEFFTRGFVSRVAIGDNSKEVQ